MRLLDTSTLQLGEFYEGKVPAYAILSHTWADGEILFRDLEGDPPTKAGWAKVQSACRLARGQGYAWIWIDTCCIDKSSSSELSEAINSMFKWYRDAEICFAYLADVPYAEPGTSECAGALASSRWFTRGWTLQELLAPAVLDFYSSDWRRIDSRSVLGGVVGKITGIDAVYLCDGKPRLAEASVAERMSWASRRRTTRAEDLAYCLLGIFDVNMPLIYGEGTKAFKRLQETIVRENDDQSVFAWGDIIEGNASIPNLSPRPLLAESPADFKNSGDVIPIWNPALETRIRIEHSGVTIITPLLREIPSKWIREHSFVFLAPLLCRRRSNLFNTIALCLRSTMLPNRTLGLNLENISCYRVSDSLLTYPKTAWTRGKLCSAFVYFDAARRRHVVDGLDSHSGCAIRTLPKGYRTGPVYSQAWGRADEMAVFPLTDRLVQSYGLTCPIVVRLEGPGGGALALVLQYQHQSLESDEQGRVRFSQTLYWMLNRVVAVPPGSTIEDVAAVVRAESEEWPADYVRQISGAKRYNDAGSLLLTDPFARSRLETFVRFRVGVSQEAVAHGGLLLVDVEDLEGENVSLEVHHGGSFIPVIGPTNE
ncbi:heterokaryon incompatibility protein [Colletotrichum tofieldiae]|nr:heterokaryon incompatibility protein [Colletotrichum tofieldiae]GKT74299.1 heterokaryon incompatibility protein [Colletotrichum tofieldiae]